MKIPGLLTLCALLLPIALFCEEAVPEKAVNAVSFRNDIRAIMTYNGCNMGACHGALTGKGELALSLRGEDPEGDYKKLISSSLWVNMDDPEKSFLLRKATLDVLHEGGKRFEEGSESWEILHQWIADGAKLDGDETPSITDLVVEPASQVVFEPMDEVQLTVTAQWSDGSSSDVTRWAIFEPSNLVVTAASDGLIQRQKAGETTVSIRYLGIQKPVKLIFVPDHPDYVWNGAEPNNFIDEHIFEKLQLIRVNPSDLCTDEVYVRRAYLTLLGMTPTAEEALAFVESTEAGKRQQLITELLERDEYADFQALRWADLLRVEEKVMDTRGVETFHAWIRESFAENKPLDQFAREILTGRGSTYEYGEANYYRALRDPTARAEAVAQVFLGTRLNCAKCHNHPFEQISMDEYYQFSAVFDGMDYRIVENKRRDKSDKNQFIGEQVVLVNMPKKLKHPRTQYYPEAALLGDGAPEVDDFNQRFEILADWVTSSENPNFARMQVNRIWFHLMGQGLVDPVDDFRSTNPASHPELLDQLAQTFVDSGYDVKAMIRLITSSKAWQLSSEPNESNLDDEFNYARLPVTRLTAEQLLDSIHSTLDVPAEFKGFDESLRAAQLPGVNKVYRDLHPSFGDRFLKLFGRPERLANSDLERNDETSLAQVFELVSGESLDTLIGEPDNRIGQLLKAEAEDREIIEALYWSALSRAPAEGELESLVDHVLEAGDRRAAHEDIAWAVLNSKEFLLRH